MLMFFEKMRNAGGSEREYKIRSCTVFEMKELVVHLMLFIN